MYQFPQDLRRFYESMRIPFVMYQYTDGKVIPVLVSDGFCRQMGTTRERQMKLLEAGRYETIHPDDAGRILQTSIGFAQRKNDYDVFFRSRHEDGYHVIHAIGYWFPMPDGTELALLTYQNLSASVESFRRADQEYHFFRQDRFYRDPLTGLPNINYLQEFANERIHALRVDGKTPMLLYTDVNSMQSYNNQYGFAKGNDLLCIIADALGKFFPEALLTRGADDHFLVIDVFPGKEELSRLMREINREIRSRAAGNTTGIQAGIVIIGERMNVDQAVDHAKNALKRIGSDLSRDFRIYSQRADEEYWEQRYIVENLDRALNERWVRVFYQGIVRLETGKSAAFEALARWNDPVRGSIPPTRFIPVLEKYHLLYKLDLYMMKEVLQELTVRKEAGLPLLPVSVNFSAQDFDYRNIPEEIESLYLSTGADRLIPRSSIIVEITEQDMATATDSFHAQLRDLRSRGYRLWLDDFGSGYSSLNVFSRIDVDLIKLDMDLIQHLDEHNGINREIIRAIIAIARAAGIETLAEGMETEEQKEFLSSVGCDLGQGFLLRRPIPLDSILYIVKSDSYVGRWETDAERSDFHSRRLTLRNPGQTPSGSSPGTSAE